MNITKDTVDHVAKLARLSLSDDEKDKLTLEMQNIISYVEKLNELDTTDIEPTAHVIPIANVFREDEVKKSYERDKILANSPMSEEGCFRVPKVVE